MVHLRIRLRLKLSTAFHTTGNRWKWGADKALVQHYDGKHYGLPATSLKGVLRDQAERLLRPYMEVCTAPNSNSMCKDLNNLCLACQVFGNPRQPSPLRFADVVLEGERQGDDEEKGMLTQIRAGVAISRRRRAAVPQRLYFVETTEPRPMEAIADIEGFFASQDEAKEAAALVVLAAKALPALGAGRTRGLGWLAEVKAECTINGQPVDDAALKHYWSQWLGGGQ